MTPINRRASSLLAIGGEFGLASMIHARLALPEVSSDDIFAAAICGDAAIVPWLLDYLEQQIHADVVAEALFLLTGAALFETVQARIRPIEPFTDDDPRDVVTVERLAQDPQRWRTWWDAHRDVIASGVRHRLGRPASPSVIGEVLHHFVLRRSVRELIADELDLHYGPELTVDVDVPVGWQRVTLARLGQLQTGPRT